MSDLALFGGPALRRDPFPSWPVFDEREERGLLEVLHSGKWWRFSYGEGVELKEPEAGQPRSKVVELQERFARLQHARYGVACANGSAAIEIALRALGVGPGDEVIVPPYTFYATASSVLLVNAVPIFADIDPRTYNLDPRRVEEAITPRTKAIVPVHFAGMAADMGALMEIAGRHGLFVVEDAAHGHGGEWNGRGLGSIGHAGTFSFQASKNMTAGEGGLVTTNDRELAALCDSFVWAGREVGRPWYEHYRLAWNYRLTEFQAAVLLAQLERVEEQNARRAERARYLDERLAEVPGIEPFATPDYATKHTYHIYMLRFDAERFGVPREDFLAALAAEGVPCMGGYTHPLYRNPVFLEQNFYPKGCPVSCGHYNQPIDYASFEERCPNAERACREAVWLEHRLLLGSERDAADVVAAVEKVYEHRDELRARRRAATE